MAGGEGRDSAKRNEMAFDGKTSVMKMEGWEGRAEVGLRKGGVKLKEAEQMKVLGIRIDGEGQGGERAVRMAEEVRRRTGASRCMAGAAWGAAEANLRVVYCGFAEAPLVYGMGAWYPGLRMKERVAGGGKRGGKGDKTTTNNVKKEGDVASGEGGDGRDDGEEIGDDAGGEAQRITGGVVTRGGEGGRMQARQWLGISEEAEVERPIG